MNTTQRLIQNRLICNKIQRLQNRLQLARQRYLEAEAKLEQIRKLAT